MALTKRQRNELMENLRTDCDNTIRHILSCPKCFDEVSAGIRRVSAGLAGSTKSEAKAKASRENGKLGGRPKKNE